MVAIPAVELADYLWWRPPGCLSLPRIHGSSPNSGPEWAWSGLWSTSTMLPLFGRENSRFLLPEICIWYIYIYIDYSQNKFISGLTSAYMGLHYLLIICHYTRVLWVAPHICALLLVLIELLVVLTGSDVQLVLGLGPSCFPSELV